MNVYIDFDNTLVNSVKAFVDRYSGLHGKQYSYKQVQEYNFEPLLHLTEEEIVRGFESKYFFTCLELYSDVTKGLQRLKSIGCKLILLTQGTPKNIFRKISWLEDNPSVRDLFDDVILCSNKTLVDVSNGILIDDYKEFHTKMNAKYHYSFKDCESYKWFSTDKNVKVFNSWTKLIKDIEEVLMKTKSTDTKTTKLADIKEQVEKCSNKQKLNNSNIKTKGGDTVGKQRNSKKRK